MNSNPPPTIPSSLNVALKEWATVCSAVAAAQQIILLRKGGIYESAGEFEIEHRRFLLFPTYLHQKAEMLKEPHRAAIRQVESEPDKIDISLAAEITDIVRVVSRSAMDALASEHIWSPKLIDMRFNYRPENPLYLLLIRAYKLKIPVTIATTPAYAGCKSWVPLERSIETTGAEPILNDSKYSAKRQRICEVMT
jgi:hypothetical protein